MTIGHPSDVDLERQLSFARAINQVATVITRDGDASSIREAMVKIIGETLDCDRTLIYDIRMDKELAVGLCEWLNPAAVGIEPTLATYPSAVFQGGIDVLWETKDFLISHVDDVHACLRGDGSAELLHDTMQIKSLLWLPFDFDEHRFFGLVFNQVRERRHWTPADRDFLRAMGELVSMAQSRIRLAEEKREREQRSEQLQRLEGLGLLAGGIAHDFNNLLTVILGNAGLIEQRLPEDAPGATQLKPMLTSIQSAAAGAGELCKQLLTYSGRSSATLGQLELSSTVEEMTKLLRISVGRKATVRYELSNRDLWVRGDRSQVQQLLLNLLTNASDALPDEGGTITVRTGATNAAAASADGVRFLSSAPEGDLRYIQVQDTGAGMDETIVSRIFEPFYSTKKAGHGLGLSTVHGILASHGAGMGVKSELGIGTTFTVAFPCSEFEAVDVGTMQYGTPCEATILVVDDEEIVRNVCESVLTLAGFKVLTAASGELAIECCATGDPAIDLVVLDLTMPGLDGRKTLAGLREAGHDFPVLMISAYGVGDALDAEQRPTSFLQKPFAAAALQGEARRLLQLVGKVQ